MKIVHILKKLDSVAVTAAPKRQPRELDVYDHINVFKTNEKAGNIFKLEALVQKMDEDLTLAQDDNRKLETKIEKMTEAAKESFSEIEDRLDAVVKSLRDFERQHPELSGYEFDDLVREIENLSDETREFATQVIDAD